MMKKSLPRLFSGQMGDLDRSSEDSENSAQNDQDMDKADLEEEKRRYHIHLTYPENKEWKDFLNFRDFLIDNPDALKEYAELKMRASLQSNQDGEIYRKMKEPIFLKFNSFKRGDISKQ